MRVRGYGGGGRNVGVGWMVLEYRVEYGGRGSVREGGGGGGGEGGGVGGEMGRLVGLREVCK